MEVATMAYETQVILRMILERSLSAESLEEVIIAIKSYMREEDVALVEKSIEQIKALREEKAE